MGQTDTQTDVQAGAVMWPVVRRLIVLMSWDRRTHRQTGRSCNVARGKTADSIDVMGQTDTQTDRQAGSVMWPVVRRLIVLMSWDRRTHRQTDRRTGRICNVARGKTADSIDVMGQTDTQTDRQEL